MSIRFSLAAVAFAAFLSLAGWACLFAAEKDDKTVTVVPDKIEWQDAASPFLPGTQIAVLEGHPEKEGAFVYRMKMPDGYKIKPHAHKKPERVTVISGEYHMGLGEAFDEGKATKLPPGSYIVRPPGTMHWGWSKGETVLQIHGEGPWQAEYARGTGEPAKTKR